MQRFKLWLEFEVVDKNTWNIKDDFCNIHVSLADGRNYGLNVWTYQFLQTSIKRDKASGDNLSGCYQLPPDLFVEELSRECIEKVITDLLEKGDLEKILNTSIIGTAGQET